MKLHDAQKQKKEKGREKIQFYPSQLVEAGLTGKKDGWEREGGRATSLVEGKGDGSIPKLIIRCLRRQKREKKGKRKRGKKKRKGGRRP